MTARETPVTPEAVTLPRWLRALPVVLLIVLGTLGPFVPENARVAALMGVLTPLAALIYGVWQTTLLAAATVAWLGLIAFEVPHVTVGDVWAAAGTGAFSVAFAWIRGLYSRDVVVFRSVAEAAQRAVLPPLPERLGAVRCAGLYRPAQRATLVGGDLYDLREGPYGVRALVGDVKGHGMTAVGTVASLMGAFREGVLDDPELDGLAARLDRRLAVDAAATGNAELFATALLLEFAKDAGGVRVVSCGHPPALLLRDGQVRELAAAPRPPLGLGGDLGGDGDGDRDGAATVTELRPGDVVLGYTDGVSEARDRQGTFYPLAERVARRFRGHGADPGAVVDFVWRDASAHAGGAIRDDVALLSLLVDGGDI